MRVVEWKEFSSLPIGTVFQEIQPHEAVPLGTLRVLEQVYVVERGPIDFIYRELLPDILINPMCDGDLPQALDANSVVSVASYSERDGLFDHENRRWLVWSNLDRASLSRAVLDPMGSVWNG